MTTYSLKPYQKMKQKSKTSKASAKNNVVLRNNVRNNFETECTGFVAFNNFFVMYWLNIGQRNR